MQKSHEVFHEKVTGKLEGQKAENTRLNMRLNKIETSHSWAVRLVIADVIVKVISTLVWSV